MKILFANEFFVVVDKPSGWLSTPARFSDDGRPVLGLILQSQLAKKIFPVHRLDFEVSGAILFALSEESQRHANSLFENRQVFKVYQALSSAEVKMDWQRGQVEEWKCRLLRGKKRAFESPHGKESLTIVEFEGVVENKNWGEALGWTLQPKTGRAHQLRYEMFRHKFPILGDKLYGSDCLTPQPHSIALRACKIQFAEKSFCQKFKLPESISVQDPLF